MKDSTIQVLRVMVTPLLFVAMIGCTVPVYNHKPALVRSSVPVENEINTVSVGDAMLTSGIRMEVDAIQFDEEFAIGPIRNFNFSPGHFIKQGEDEVSEFFRESELPDSGEISQNLITQNFSSLQVMKADAEICAVMVNGGKFCRDDIQYQRVAVATSPRQSAQQRLVYRGRVGDVVSLQYQEYVGGTAAPGEVENLKFDMSSATVMALKNARLEIVDASAENITYKVLHSFNASEATIE